MIVYLFNVIVYGKSDVTKQSTI